MVKCNQHSASHHGVQGSNPGQAKLAIHLTCEEKLVAAFFGAAKAKQRWRGNMPYLL